MASFLCLFAPLAQGAVPANGRAWELVTAREASSTRNLGLKPMGWSGDRIVYATVGPAVKGPSGAMLGYGTSVRGPSGWTIKPLGFVYKSESVNVFELFSPIMPFAFAADGLTSAWIASVQLTPDGQPEFKLGLYRSINEGPPEYIAQVGEGTTFLNYSGFADIASDGSRVVFTTADHVLPSDAGRTEGSSVYAWDGNAVEQLDVDNNGDLISTCGTKVSEDNGMTLAGDRVFFTVPWSCAGIESVYMRDLDTDETTKISTSQCTRIDCNAVTDVSYSSSTQDGSTVYMTSAQQLTNDDEDDKRDLYGYDVASGDLTLLSGGTPAASGEVINTAVYPSEDKSRVYFRAIGELLPGETSTSDEKVFVVDSSGVHFVARAAFVAPFFPEPAVQLSADGRRALFVTPTQSLPEDTDNVADAYLYDADAKTLTRIAQSPLGGNGEYAVGINAPEFINRFEYEFGNLRPYWAIDASGEHVFFATKESLVPEDNNGAFDVYEYTQGALGLLTPGYQSLESVFGGVSRDGKSLMFATSATLLPEDIDGEGRDVYVARLGGGFPPLPPPGQCTSSTCPLPSGTRVTRPTPATLTPPPPQSGKLRLLEVAKKAKKGAIGVVVSVPAPGLVVGQIWTRSGGKKVVLASGQTGATNSGKTRLALQLKPAARKAPAVIKKGHLTVSAGSSKASKVVEVTLR